MYEFGSLESSLYYKAITLGNKGGVPTWLSNFNNEVLAKKPCRRKWRKFLALWRPRWCSVVLLYRWVERCKGGTCGVSLTWFTCSGSADGLHYHTPARAAWTSDPLSRLLSFRVCKTILQCEAWEYFITFLIGGSYSTVYCKIIYFLNWSNFKECWVFVGFDYSILVYYTIITI